ILFLACSPSQAADSALDAISTDASVVIRFKTPKATLEKAKDLANAASKEFGKLVADKSARLGDAISNPELEGVDMESDWWMAVYAAPEKEEPDVVFIIPATDIKAMKQALGE